MFQALYIANTGESNKQIRDHFAGVQWTRKSLKVIYAPGYLMVLKSLRHNSRRLITENIFMHIPVRLWKHDLPAHQYLPRIYLLSRMQYQQVHSFFPSADINIQYARK